MVEIFLRNIGFVQCVLLFENLNLITELKRTKNL